MESSPTSLSARTRAKTLQDGPKPAATTPKNVISTSDDVSTLQHGDIFEKESAGAPDGSSTVGAVAEDVQELPSGFHDLPIELLSLTDRFIESLTAKVHTEPPSIERLSDMFQDFYSNAESHIATHISALSTKNQRGASPSPSISSKSSGKMLKSMSSKDTFESSNSAPEQQMLTPQEISDRRKARRLLEQKRLALEEAVERRVCERVYRRIWRHRSTLDEVRDEKLRSRTAALALVGIGLKDLGIYIDSALSSDNDPGEPLDSQIEKWIAPARDGLLRMNEARSPLGKLQHLTAAHKCIVDVLSRLRQSSSSADEILPTLIYTLITSPTEGINVISNLNFTQRFRSSSKIDGEAAYCLTNLEAAITFLETVDLATLRSDEPLQGPPKSSSRPSTPHGDASSDWTTKPSLPSSAAVVASPPRPLFSDPLLTPESEKDDPLSPLSHRRRRSTNLLQPTTSALGAAGDAVRSTADQGLKNIGSTLDQSFKFLFGRLKEQHVGENGGDAGAVILPKTLDDARKLVDPQPAEDDQGNISGASSIADKSDDLKENGTTFDEKLLGVFAGRKQLPRERSVDSSGSGGKKVAFANNSDQGKSKSDSTGQLSSSPSAREQLASAPNTAVESMRNLGNSLNPLNRFAGMSVMRGLGRNSSGTTPTVSTVTAGPESQEKAPDEKVEASTMGTTPLSQLMTSHAPHVPFNVAPPIQRFMDVSDAAELKVGEVTELLKDYQRLAAALKNVERI
ncbi:MAG: hypothetical protein LQ337_003845 [Flavoplaca oasis]|nr:MAG: hypothetical protein LQ337_003845 [Flavoplaca oasis]